MELDGSRLVGDSPPEVPEDTGIGTGLGLALVTLLSDTLIK
jgi:hypothetical protein